MDKEYYLTNERRMNTVQDGFGWNEIDCFNKPLSLILENLRKNLHDVYLFNIGLTHSYLIDGWYPKIFEDEKIPQEDFEHYFKQYFSDVYGVKKENLLAYDEEQLKIQIKGCLDNGGIALVPCDIFDLYYFDNYHKEHMEHFFIVEGYDHERELFYIIDTLHVNFARNAEYKQFVITTHQLYKLYQDYFSFFYPEEKKKSFWSFARTDKDIDVLTNNRKEYKKLVSEIIQEKTKVRYVEEEICEQMQNAVGEEKQELIAKNIERVFKRGNYRKVYYSLLLKNFIDKNQSKDIEEKIDEILQLWNQIKNLITYYYAAKKDNFSEITALINVNKNNEKELWDKIYRNL